LSVTQEQAESLHVQAFNSMKQEIKKRSVKQETEIAAFRRPVDERMNPKI
jgi:hypothetical protein